MKNPILNASLIATIALGLSCAGANAKAPLAPANEPISKECSFKEVYSSSEVMLKATGWGTNVEEANNDLLRSAIWFVLFNGTDPLLNNPEQIASFEKVKPEYYSLAKIRTFITWEAAQNDQQVAKQINGIDGYKRTKHVRVNKKAIVDDLVKKGIIMAQADLHDALGTPTIMVIPEAPKGENALTVLDKNNLAKHAAGVIESHLTAKQYEVIIPRGADQLNEVAKMQSELSTGEEDPSYQLALSMGSDVYLIYSGQVQNGKASVVVKAYETTTARALGTETGYSQQRPGSPMEPLVEEAINDAIDKVLQRLNNYWTADLKKGVQYKVLFKFLGNWNKHDLQQAKDDISSKLEDKFKTKENVVTDKTADILVWASPEDFNKSSKVSRTIRKELGKYNITEININKKLIILGVDKP